MSLYKELVQAKKSGEKKWIPLLDPDKCSEDSVKRLVTQLAEKPICWLVGGSLISSGSINQIIGWIRKYSSQPICLFPGSAHHFCPEADALLLLSLISGRNPNYLIGQHVETAMTIARSKVEVIPTGYILVKCGSSQTTAEYLSGSASIPYGKTDIAVATAVAGELLGLKAIYLDGGSGAEKAISADMITAVAGHLNVPLLVGGGIRTKEALYSAWNAGADLVIIGTALEDNPNLVLV